MMGVNIDQFLNLDMTRSTARQILPKGDARIGQIDTLTVSWTPKWRTNRPTRPTRSLPARPAPS